MKYVAILATAISFYAGTALAFDEGKAARLVRDYSETIACVFEDSTYKAVKVVGDASDQMGDQYVVHWYGDVGCGGGSGSSGSVFTVVEVRAFNTPVVLPKYEMSDMHIVEVTKFSGGNGRIFIDGLAYGPNDTQRNPTKKMSYTLKLDFDKFVIEQVR